MGLSESEFAAIAERALSSIETAVEDCGNDIDVTRSGNVLTLELPNGSRIIVNIQMPTRQIWVAARSGGYHYEWRAPDWRDTRDGSELFASLSRLLSAQGGAAIELRPG